MKTIEPPETIPCPYPGLRPFRREEAIVFFGRDEQVDQLLAKLDRSRFLAVVGTSGCGKSSLVRAGLIPALKTGLMVSGGARWAIATMRPGDQPIRNLARALIDDGVVAGPASAGEHAPEFLTAALRRGPLGLAEALRDAPPPGQRKLLLLIDQFEEIFRFRREGDRDEADAFVELLLASAVQEDVPIYVVLTMRSDYLGDCNLFAGLPEALNDSQFLTPRLTRDQRREAIEAPALVFEGQIEPALVNRVLNDMDAGPDQLPLMQHALMRLWTRACRAPAPSIDAVPGSREIVLALADYEAIGGLKTALSGHADEVFDRLDEGQRTIAEVLFRGLSERGAEGRDIRRPTPLRSVAEVAGVPVERVVPVVEAFRHPDLSVLVPPLPTPLGPETILDISHESLIRQWQRLQAWAEAEASSADMYRRLERTAFLWCMDRAGLWDTPDLEFALEWWARERPNAAWALRYGGDFDDARLFLSTSRKAQSASSPPSRNDRLPSWRLPVASPRRRRSVDGWRRSGPTTPNEPPCGSAGSWQPSWLSRASQWSSPSPRSSREIEHPGPVPWRTSGPWSRENRLTLLSRHAERRVNAQTRHFARPRSPPRPRRRPSSKPGSPPRPRRRPSGKPGSPPLDGWRRKPQPTRRKPLQRSQPRDSSPLSR